jgi:hypothetical protein
LSVCTAVPSGSVNNALATPFETFAVTGAPTIAPPLVVTVNCTVPLLTVPDGLVTAADSVRSCAEGL